MKNWTGRCLGLVGPPQSKVGQWCATLKEIQQLGESPERITRHLEIFVARLKKKHQHPSYFKKTYAQWSPEIQQRVAVDRELDRQEKARDDTGTGLSRLDVL